jgi:single-stranded DNA-specific DHH superfamily exonuclease
MTDSIISHTEISRSLPIVDLKTMDDETIKSLIAEGYKLLNRRKREREKAIREQIKELAASEGLKVSFREPVERKKRSMQSTESN